MKKTLLIILVLLGFNLNAQVATTPEPLKDSGWFFSARAGYDIIPMYDNQTPYIDYKGGIELGASADYYWNWLGLGFDFDFIKNKPQSTYPTKDVYWAGGLVKNWDLTENGITRLFFGIGPDFKYQHNKLMAELNLRAGYGLISGGKVNLTETTFSPPTTMNYHAGYSTGAISSKTQLRFTYFFKPNWGLQIGGYYMNHYKVKESANKSGIASSYHDYREFVHGNNHYIDVEIEPTERKPIEHKISSIGIFAGITYHLPVKPKPVTVKEKKAPAPAPQKYDLTVTAKDKFTHQILPDTDVVLKNMKGEVIGSGRTNNFGVVVFKDISPGNYTIEGALDDKNLESNSVAKNEFVPGKTLQKDILYTDEDFILKGNVVACNTQDPVQDVDVILKNTDQAIQKSTKTDEKGNFKFHLKQKANFDIYGKKQKYFSQTEKISTGDFDRNKTLFIKLEICMDKADCGSAIRLNNIHYDLDKYYIREDAKPELDKLVEFMKDNPDIKVEVSSHTDSRGSDAYNLRLSQNRAKAAVDYIVSKGISADRIKGVGYGETRLLNHCGNGVKCSEAEHELNRRTEMKVICPE